jgi:hypothetical protein
MTDPKPPGEGAHGWRTPHEDECANVDRDVYIKDTMHVINRVMGYYNGDLTYYHFEPVELTDPNVVHAQIWTDDYAVRHLTYRPVRTVVSDVELDTLTCLADVVRTVSASLNTAMRY